MVLLQSDLSLSLSLCVVRLLRSPAGRIGMHVCDGQPGASAYLLHALFRLGNGTVERVMVPTELKTSLSTASGVVVFKTLR